MVIVFLLKINMPCPAAFIHDCHTIIASCNGAGDVCVDIQHWGQYGRFCSYDCKSNYNIANCMHAWMDIIIIMLTVTMIILLNIIPCKLYIIVTTSTALGVYMHVHSTLGMNSHR